MKIGLFGYGKMGREIESVAIERDHMVALRVDEHNRMSITEADIKACDVIIDFSTPQSVLGNMHFVLNAHVPMVVGTTGWYDNLPKIKKLVSGSNGGFIYAKNFSVGANIFFKIVAEASKLFNKYEGYDVYGYEIHHSGKKDSPSGTAKKIADTIISNFSSKKSLMAEKLDRQVKSSELHFASIRGGRNPGTHEVIFDSEADEVRLSHIAHGRRGFAQGAVLAAEFIKGRKGFFAFEELFEKGSI